jgi:hypothetical protein
LSGTPAEIKAYSEAKAASGYAAIADDSEGPHKGALLYFTSRSLSSTMEYKLNGTNLDSSASAEQQKIVDALATIGSTSLNDLQKYAAMKTAGLI